MVVENLSQRGNDFHEEQENIRAVEEYLNSNQKILHALRLGRTASKDSKGRKNLGSLQKKEFKDKATARDVEQWLKLSKIAERILVLW